MCSVNSCFFQTTNASLYHDTIVACLPDCKNWYSFKTNCALDLRFFLGCLLVFFSFFPFLDFFGLTGFFGFLRILVGTLLLFAPQWLVAEGGTGRAGVPAGVEATTCCGRSLLLVVFLPSCVFFLFIILCCGRLTTGFL